VRTLRELATAQALELARALPLGFTRVKHLQFLATRELERLPSGSRPRRPARATAAFDTFTRRRPSRSRPPGLSPERSHPRLRARRGDPLDAVAPSGPH
jgi:hypothetical protein